MGFQSGGSPNFGNFGTPNLGVLGQNDIWVQPMWPDTDHTIKGKVVASPQVRAMVSSVSLCMPVVHPCTKNVPIMH
jgi:hypothetical protein